MTMKKILKPFLISLVALGTLTLSACSLDDILKGVDSAQRDSERKGNDAVSSAAQTLVIDANGHFDIERLYHFDDSLNGVQFDYTFAKGGALTVKNVSTEESKTYSYTVIDNLIKIISTADQKEEYLDYCDDILYHPVYAESSSIEGSYTFGGGLIGVLHGVAASQKKSNSVVGYHLDMEVSVGDTKAVFTTDKKTTKGFAYPIYARGTIETGTNKSAVKAIDSTQIVDGSIDSSKVAKLIIPVAIGQKTYKGILRVRAAS